MFPGFSINVCERWTRGLRNSKEIINPSRVLFLDLLGLPMCFHIFTLITIKASCLRAMQEGKKIGKEKAKKRWRRNLPNPFHIFPHPWIMFVKWKSFFTWSYVQRSPKWTRRTFKCKASGNSDWNLSGNGALSSWIAWIIQNLQDHAAIKATKPIIYAYFSRKFSFPNKSPLFMLHYIYAATYNSRFCDESRKIFKL